MSVDAPSLPTKGEVVERYASRSDRPLHDLQWYHVLACYRLGLILEGTHARACAGMAPKERVALMELAARLARARQIAVLFTEHDMDVVFSQADRIVVLDRGRLIAGGLPAEVRANPNVREVYLGSMH